MNPKRKAVQDYVLKTLKLQEPGEYNHKRYEEFFDSLDDKAFDQWMRILKDNHHAKITLMIPPFKVVIDPKDSFTTAKFLGLELMERLRLWDPIGKRYCLTPEKYYILSLPIRRLKQYGLDGLSVPDSDRRLNPLTDQVVKPDKGSAISFPQAQMIAEKGLTTTLHELMTVRGGDLEAYSKMKAQIEETGEASIDVMEGTSGVKSVRTLRSFLNAMHLESNI
jgi:hypothetical protein